TQRLDRLDAQVGARVWGEFLGRVVGVDEGLRGTDILEGAKGTDGSQSAVGLLVFLGSVAQQGQDIFLIALRALVLQWFAQSTQSPGPLVAGGVVVREDLKRLRRMEDRLDGVVVAAEFVPEAAAACGQRTGHQETAQQRCPSPRARPCRFVPFAWL